MGAGERPRAQSRVEGHVGRRHRGDVGRDLGVPELADVEVAHLEVLETERLSQPPQEDVAGGLHQPLALDHPPSLVGELGSAGEPLQHRTRRLLRLQEQRIARVASEQQDHPAAASHASDADDLTRKVGVPEALQQPAAVAGQAAQVRPQQVKRGELEPLRPLAVDEIPDRHDQRPLSPDPRFAVGVDGKPGERPPRSPGSRSAPPRSWSLRSAPT